MKTPAQKTRAALTAAGIPATVLSLELSPGRTVTVAFTLTENIHGDIYEATRSPGLEEIHQTVTRLAHWASQVDPI